MPPGHGAFGSLEVFGGASVSGAARGCPGLGGWLSSERRGWLLVSLRSCGSAQSGPRPSGAAGRVVLAGPWCKQRKDVRVGLWEPCSKGAGGQHTAGSGGGCGSGGSTLESSRVATGREEKRWGQLSVQDTLCALVLCTLPSNLHLEKTLIKGNS